MSSGIRTYVRLVENCCAYNQDTKFEITFKISPEMKQSLNWTSHDNPEYEVIAELLGEEAKKAMIEYAMRKINQNSVMEISMYPKKMTKEQLEKLEREWLDSGDWKITSLDLDFKVWLGMKGYKLNQKEFNELKTKER